MWLGNFDNSAGDFSDSQLTAFSDNGAGIGGQEEREGRGRGRREERREEKGRKKWGVETGEGRWMTVMPLLISVTLESWGAFFVHISISPPNPNAQ